MIGGIAFVMLAAVFLGTFALPSKYVRNYSWENTWGAFFFIGMLIVPVAFTFLTVKGLWATYSQVSPSIIFGVIALGFLWGCAFCCWGHGLAMLGLSLGYSLCMGTQALVGSMFPFFLGHADKAGTLSGLVVIGGILICICGVAVSGYAGVQREKSQASDRGEQGSKKKHALKGVILCLTAGALAANVNIAYYIGQNLGNITGISEQQFGNPQWLVGLAVWMLICLGGLVSAFGFSAILLFKNKTWKNFLAKGAATNLTCTALMAVGHFACLFFYGIGSWKIGVFGTSVGFAIFQSGSLLVGNTLGFMTGEWENTTQASKNVLFMGLGILILGIIIVSYGNAMM